MEDAIRGLYERYRTHHDMDRPLLQWIGFVGIVAFPFFYLLRRNSDLPPPFDDLVLRLVAALLCVGLALRAAWPVRWRGYYLAYSYATLVYSLPFLLSFTTLKNQGGLASIVSMVMAAIIVGMLADWRNAFVMLSIGYTAGFAAYAATETELRIPFEFIMAAAGSLLVLVAGALSDRGQRREELERMMHKTTVAQGERAVRKGLEAVELTLRHLKQEAADHGAWQKLSARDCVQKAVERFTYESPAERKSVNVAVESDFEFQGNEATVLLMLFNLMQNAMDSSARVPHIQITLRVEATPEHRILVFDSGPGIDPKVMARVFGDSGLEGDADGTRTGIAFCRRVMKTLGGEVGCVTRPGEFTEVSLNFPRGAAAPRVPVRAAPEALTAPVELQNMRLLTRLAERILVVDDSSMSRAVARAVLHEFECEVMEAEDAAQALQLLRDGAAPDAILMDMNMPGMSGVDATREIRGMPGFVARTPILLVTADPTTAVKQAAFEAGVDAFLIKPLDPEQLRTKLAILLGKEPKRISAVPPPPF